MKQQHGFAHAVLIIGLVIALIGALGFIFWQNFIHEEPVVTKTELIKSTSKEPEATENEASSNIVFDNSEISFEYPTGWREKDDEYIDNVARIETNEFERNIGMGLKTGAELTINQTTEDVAPPQFAGVSNIEEVQLPIGMGYKYEIRYEGFRLQAKVLSKGPKYLVTMQTAAEPSEEEKEMFNLVLETLRVK